MSLAVAIEFKRYKIMVEKTLGQVSDHELNRVPFDGGNSIAMIVRHLSGNLKSRFTNFLTDDGEKVWRNRENEFASGYFDRIKLLTAWDEAWSIVLGQLEVIAEEDLTSMVVIRGVKLPVVEALNRSVSHVAYHVGQIILLGRMYKGSNWEWISIPPGKSDEYNANPTLEKYPGAHLAKPGKKEE